MHKTTSYYSNNLFFIIDSTLTNPLSQAGSGIVSGDAPVPSNMKNRYFHGTMELVLPKPPITLGTDDVIELPYNPGVITAEEGTPNVPGPMGVPTQAPVMQGSQPVGGISTGPMSTPTGGGGY